MSLTGLLKAGHGPVWSWFAETFPETRAVTTDANRHLRGGGTAEPCSVPTVAGADPGLVGTAVGYLLSAHLRPDALERTVATAGASQLFSVPIMRRARPWDIERGVVERIAELRPWSTTLTRPKWGELARLAVILARFEQVFRAGPAVIPYHP